MNKAILMSIQPKWLVKILNGEKTMEIRRSVPDCKLPIDVYLYCTKGKPYISQKSRSKFTKLMNGKVVAKFTLNISQAFDSALGNPGIYTKANFGDIDVVQYGKGKILYAWHIDNLVIFDKPKELSEFKVVNPYVKNVGSFGWMFSEDELPKYLPLTKAPQSWQYAWLWE